MNIMYSNIKTVFVAFLVITQCNRCMENISYAQADENDLYQLFQLYETIEKNEKYKEEFVVLPKEIRLLGILHSLQGGQFFVARNEEKNVIGFVKLSCIANLHTEAFLQKKFNFNDDELMLNTAYVLPVKKKQSDMLQLVLSEYEHKEKYLKKPEKYYKANKFYTYIYYAGAFIDTFYKDKSLKSKLISYAFDQVLQKSSGTHILVYGQIKKNSHKNDLVNYFAYAIAKKHNLLDTIKINHIQHIAYKQKITYDQKAKQWDVSFPKKNIGRANMVLALLHEQEKRLSMSE